MPTSSPALLAACRAASKAMSASMRTVFEAAKAAGVKRPGLFFEAEAGRMFVLDKDNPAYEARSAVDRQKGIVADVVLTTAFDVGAW